MKKLLPILVSLAVAAIATVGILNWSKGQQAQMQAANIIVAAKAIARGEPIGSDAIRVAQVQVPAGAGQNALFRRIMEETITPEKSNWIAGRVLTRDVSEGEPILQRMVELREEATPTRDWKKDIPQGMRAISIPVDNIAAVSGLIDVGDSIDILVTLQVPDEKAKPEPTRPTPMEKVSNGVLTPAELDTPTRPMTFQMFEDVRILAIGKDTLLVTNKDEAHPDRPVLVGRRGERMGSITFAVSPEQASNLAFAISENSAKFILTLRRPGETGPTAKHTASFETFLKTFQVQ